MDRQVQPKWISWTCQAPVCLTRGEPFTLVRYEHVGWQNIICGRLRNQSELKNYVIVFLPLWQSIVLITKCFSGCRGWIFPITLLIPCIIWRAFLNLYTFVSPSAGTLTFPGWMTEAVAVSSSPKNTPLTGPAGNKMVPFCPENENQSFYNPQIWNGVISGLG